MAVPENRRPNEKNQRRELFRLISVASTVGIQLVLSTFIGLGIGWFLDERLLPAFLPFNTSPWFTLIFLLIGIAAGFKYLFRVALRQKDDGDSEQGS